MHKIVLLQPTNNKETKMQIERVSISKKIVIISLIFVYITNKSLGIYVYDGGKKVYESTIFLYLSVQ
jgi:hypothetical protein